MFSIYIAAKGPSQAEITEMNINLARLADSVEDLARLERHLPIAMKQPHVLRRIPISFCSLKRYQYWMEQVSFAFHIDNASDNIDYIYSTVPR